MTEIHDEKEGIAATTAAALGDGAVGAPPPTLVPGTRAALGEELVLCHDRATGLCAALAIDDTTLGPGLGGVRWMPYPSFSAAVEEACRLSRVMTLKNSLAGIPYGGAKSVIMQQGDAASLPNPRAANLLAFATSVRRLGGAYIPGVDMGTSVADLAVIATVAPWVGCNHEDPSPATARGVFAAIEAAVHHTLGRDLTGVKVVVRGAGHVGSELAGLLADRGAVVGIADVDPQRAGEVARRVGGSTVPPRQAHAQPCDVFAPCASARVLHAQSIDELRCALVVGAANDVLAARTCAGLLADKGIVYIPDFVSNAGGVIQIHAERVGWDASRLEGALTAIGARTAALLAASAASGTLPLEVAEHWASVQLSHPVAIPD